MVSLFSGNNRTRILERMCSSQLDLLVIGGGITGAGIALDAQTRGINTGLVEMQDFAEGTSSRSTKLVHGGLRYLKQMEIKLVAEVGRERAIVYENAPHVTTPIWMLLPLYKKGTFGRLSTSLGLKIYDFLAKVKKEEQRMMLTRNEVLEKEPLLNQEDLLGGGYYVEYRTDDARLTLEVIKAAFARGARVVNYAKAEELLYDEKGTLKGIRVVDQVSQKSFNIYAKKIVNATGPWVDFIREKDHSKKGKTLHLTKGVHIVIDHERFPLRQAIYYDTPQDDGRMVFAIPRGEKVYIGTTDTDYHDDINDIKIDKQDSDYLLETINHMFPNMNLSSRDIESSWAGVRPLIHEEGKDPSEISRKDEIFVSSSNLITIAGGKLTGYRKMAERTVDLVADQLARETGVELPPCQTVHLELSGGQFGGSKHFEEYVKEKLNRAFQLGLSSEEAEPLIRLYGSNVDAVFAKIESGGKEANEFGLSPSVYGALVYGIESEMVATPKDFFIRRTSALFFDIDWVITWKDSVLHLMSKQFGWSEDEKATHKEELEREIKQACLLVK